MWQRGRGRLDGAEAVTAPHDDPGDSDAGIETERLILRRPRAEDAEAIFTRYASDPDVTRYMGWPRHEHIRHTHAFLRFSDIEWGRWPAGPYLILSRADGTVLGSTGLAFETPHQAETGYVLARDAWGRGYASEALAAMIERARQLGVTRLYARCHPDHHASRRVLEKAGFVPDEPPTVLMSFPNLDSGAPRTALCYSAPGTAGRSRVM